MFFAAVLRYNISAFMFLIIGLYPVSSVFAQQGRYGDWQMGPSMMGGWGMGWFGGIFMMVFWILMIVGFIFLIKLLVQAAHKSREGGESGSKAMAILKERYALGKINKSQFEAMKQDLRS